MPPSAYTPSQLAAYLDHINFPPHLRPTPSSPPTLDLALLTLLHTYQLSAIPYENLLLHYSPHHTVSLDPQDIYAKVVTAKRGRGGYCMENSIFFNHILRAVGFDAYTTGARIRMRKDGVPQGDYIGWCHIVNIITLPSGQKYMSDVSFGGDGATLPLPLEPGTISKNIGAQELRLAYEALPEQVHPASKSWIYQYRNGPDRAWNSYYAFSEIEWTQADFVASNFWVSKAEGSFQRWQVLVIRFLRREGGMGEGEGCEGWKREGGGIFGKRMLVDGVVKENLGGKTVVVRECRTEAERVEALRELFGIELTDEEVQGIRGTSTELRG